MKYEESRYENEEKLKSKEMLQWRYPLGCNEIHRASQDALIHLQASIPNVMMPSSYC
jgi:hypothetical protein